MDASLYAHLEARLITSGANGASACSEVHVGVGGSSRVMRDLDSRGDTGFSTRLCRGRGDREVLSWFASRFASLTTGGSACLLMCHVVDGSAGPRACWLLGSQHGSPMCEVTHGVPCRVVRVTVSLMKGIGGYVRADDRASGQPCQDSSRSACSSVGYPKCGPIGQIMHEPMCRRVSPSACQFAGFGVGASPRKQTGLSAGRLSRCFENPMVNRCDDALPSKCMGSMPGMGVRGHAE